MNRSEILKIAASIMGAGLSGSLSRNTLAGLTPISSSSDSFVSACCPYST